MGYGTKAEGSVRDGKARAWRKLSFGCRGGGRLVHAAANRRPVIAGQLGGVGEGLVGEIRRQPSKEFETRDVAERHHSTR